jgi:hypothetical protein
MQFFDDEMQQSFEKGMDAGTAADVLEILEARGLAVSGAARERMLGCTDLAALSRWIRLAATVGSIDALFE